MEKYRPKYVREIVGNREAVERLQVISEEGNMPNIILSVSAPLATTAPHTRGACMPRPLTPSVQP